MKIRLKFSKLGMSRYISHLDLYHMMQRAFKRARVKIWYSEGFNPQAYISFLAALPLGYESECEFFDCKILDDNLDIIDKLNLQLPSDVRIISVNSELMDTKLMAFAEYDVHFENENFGEFLNSPEIVIRKKAKKGRSRVIREIDVKEFVDTISIDGDRWVVRLPNSVVGGYNPSQILRAFDEEMYFSVRKMRVLTSEMGDFA
jgi:radical SAM-linked protein